MNAFALIIFIGTLIAANTVTLEANAHFQLNMYGFIFLILGGIATLRDEIQDLK